MNYHSITAIGQVLRSWVCLNDIRGNNPSILLHQSSVFILRVRLTVPMTFILILLLCVRDVDDGENIHSVVVGSWLWMINE